MLLSEIDNDVYCVCTHDFLLCTHRKFGTVRTMYAVKISGTQTVFGFMRTRIKNPFQLVLSGCYINNINVAFARSILTYHAI